MNSPNNKAQGGIIKKSASRPSFNPERKSVSNRVSLTGGGRKSNSGNAGGDDAEDQIEAMANDIRELIPLVQEMRLKYNSLVEMRLTSQGTHRPPQGNTTKAPRSPTRRSASPSGRLPPQASQVPKKSTKPPIARPRQLKKKESRFAMGSSPPDEGRMLLQGLNSILPLMGHPQGGGGQGDLKDVFSLANISSSLPAVQPSTRTQMNRNHPFAPSSGLHHHHLGEMDFNSAPLPHQHHHQHHQHQQDQRPAPPPLLQPEHIDLLQMFAEDDVMVPPLPLSGGEPFWSDMPPPPNHYPNGGGNHPHAARGTFGAGIAEGGQAFFPLRSSAPQLTFSFEDSGYPPPQGSMPQPSSNHWQHQQQHHHQQHHQQQQGHYPSPGHFSHQRGPMSPSERFPSFERDGEGPLPSNPVGGAGGQRMGHAPPHPSYDPPPHHSHSHSHSHSQQYPAYPPSQAHPSFPRQAPPHYRHSYSGGGVASGRGDYPPAPSYQHPNPSSHHPVPPSGPNSSDALFKSLPQIGNADFFPPDEMDQLLAFVEGESGGDSCLAPHGPPPSQSWEHSFPPPTSSSGPYSSSNQEQYPPQRFAGHYGHPPGGGGGGGGGGMQCRSRPPAVSHPHPHGPHSLTSPSSPYPQPPSWLPRDHGPQAPMHHDYPHTQGPQGHTQGPQGHTQGPQGDTQGPQGDTQGPQGDTQGPQGDTQNPQGHTQGPQGHTQGPQASRMMPYHPPEEHRYPNPNPNPNPSSYPQQHPQHPGVHSSWDPRAQGHYPSTTQGQGQGQGQGQHMNGWQGDPHYSDYPQGQGQGQGQGHGQIKEELERTISGGRIGSGGRLGSGRLGLFSSDFQM